MQLGYLVISCHLLSRAKHACALAPGIVSYIILMNDSKECYATNEDEDTHIEVAINPKIISWEQLVATNPKGTPFFLKLYILHSYCKRYERT